MKDGFFEFHVSMGSGNKLFGRSQQRISSSSREEIVIKFEKKNEKASLEIEGQPKVDSTISRSLNLNLRASNLFIGKLNWELFWRVKVSLKLSH